VFLGLVFYPHLGNENLVSLQNLNPSLVFVHQEYSLLLAEGYRVKRKAFFCAVCMKRQVNSTHLQEP
jgi:hypothetical protein